MTDDAGQLALKTCAVSLVRRLGSCEGALRHRDDTEHLQHREFAQRARLLALYIDRALDASDALAYPASFALLRAALEHRVFDRLLFLARVHEQVYEGITEEVWARWQAQPPEHLSRWERLPRDRVRIIWRGVHVIDDQGRVLYDLSIYYQWWKEYDPLVIPARDLDQIAPGHPSEREQMAEHYRSQHELWQEALAWKNLKANLLLNSLASAREVLQLDVHHRFLSAFVHPFSEHVTDAVYRQRIHGDWPTDEHYAAELVLLYACAFAIDELRDFERMTQHEPIVDLSPEWNEVRTEVASAEREIAHLWAPGRPPYSYDRAKEANQRGFDMYTAQHAAGLPITRPPFIDPGSLPDDEVRYYPDPLRRLVQLHAGFAEGTTGVWWASPWPRQDAQIRS